MKIGFRLPVLRSTIIGLLLPRISPTFNPIMSDIRNPLLIPNKNKKLSLSGLLVLLSQN